MALNIKNPAVEALAEAVAELTGESKTEAIRRALEERRGRLDQRRGGDDRAARLRRFLERELWPAIPAHLSGQRRSRADEDAALGFGPDGV